MSQSVRKIGTVTLGIASFLMNCIYFSNSNTTERPRDGTRTFMCRVHDPKNPVDGKGKVYLDTSPPCLAWGSSVYTHNTLWNFDVTLPAATPDAFVDGVPIAKSMITYWEYMNFDGPMSVKFSAHTDKGRRVALSFVVLERLLVTPLRLGQAGTVVTLKDRDVMCKIVVDNINNCDTIEFAWGPGSGAKPNAITRQYLTALLRSVGLRAVNERGQPVAIANSAAVHILVQAFEGGAVKAQLKLTGEILAHIA